MLSSYTSMLLYNSEFCFFSKLFCKKIEEFVGGSQATSCSGQENASTLFRYWDEDLILITCHVNRVPV